MPLLPIVFWSAAAVGFLGLAAGAVWREPVTCGIGAALSACLCLYFAASPFPWQVLGLVALAGNALAVVASLRGRRGWALGWLVPFAILLVCAGRLTWLSATFPAGAG